MITYRSSHRPYLSGNRIAQFDLDSSAEKNMYPQPLSIAQPIILRLHLSKHNLPLVRVPQEQIWDASTALLILLRHDLADGRKCFATKTLNNLN